MSGTAMELDGLELDARRLGVLEIERSKRHIAFKIAPGRTAAFDRWLAVLGFFAIYFVVLALAPAFVAWVGVSVAGVVLLRAANARYAFDAAARRSRFHAIDEPIELRATRATANEYEDEAGDPYRAPPVQRPRFDSIVIDGRKHALDAVESFRLAAYTGKSAAGYVIVEMRDRERGTVRYQVAGFSGKKGRARARRLRDLLATLCGVSPGQTVTLPKPAGSGDPDADAILMLVELSVTIGLVTMLPSIVHGPAGAVRVLGAVVIGVIEWARMRTLVRREVAKRDALAKALEDA